MIITVPGSDVSVRCTALRCDVIGRRLIARGALDYTTSGGLRDVLIRLERLGRPFEVDLSAIRFADSSGLAPLFESVRRSRKARRPELSIAAISQPARRVLDLLRVEVDPLDVTAWDRSTTLPTFRLSPEAVAGGDNGGRRLPGGPAPATTDLPRWAGTLISTTRCDVDAATVRVAGVLDDPAAYVLCALLAGHSAHGRTDLTIDVRQVDRVTPTAIDRIAAGVRSLRVKVALVAFRDELRSALAGGATPTSGRATCGEQHR